MSFICEVLELPKSSYYFAAQPRPRQIQDAELTEAIRLVFRQHKGRYGYRRIHQELVQSGRRCAAGRVRQLMLKAGLQALQPRSFRPSTSDGRADQPSANRLADQKPPVRPGLVWAGDITYLATAQGWCYLAVVIDLCTREVVGWSIAKTMKAELVCDALEKALASKPRESSLIFHSDRGSQYGSKKFRQLLARHAVTQSMSRRANPYDNAWTESFMGTLKLEEVQDVCYLDADDARRAIFRYVDGYYNTLRLHSSIGYRKPLEYFKSFYLN